jgi:hypothetical protein
MTPHLLWLFDAPAGGVTPGQPATVVAVAASAAVGAAPHSDITLYRGEDVMLRFQLNPAVDVSSWSLRAGLRRFSGSAGNVAGFPRVAMPKAGGVAEVALYSTDLALLPTGLYKMDLRRTDAGKKQTLADVHLRVRREVTA